LQHHYHQHHSLSMFFPFISTYNLKTYGYRSFAVSAPALWNSLPSNIRNIDCLATFKTELKTY